MLNRVVLLCVTHSCTLSVFHTNSTQNAKACAYRQRHLSFIACCKYLCIRKRPISCLLVLCPHTKKLSMGRFSVSSDLVFVHAVLCFFPLRPLVSVSSLYRVFSFLPCQSHSILRIWFLRICSLCAFRHNILRVSLVSVSFLFSSIHVHGSDCSVSCAFHLSHHRRSTYTYHMDHIFVLHSW